MNFYTNVQVLGRNIAVRAIEDGNRIKYRDDFNPSLFIPDRNNENKFKTLDGVSVAQVKPLLISIVMWKIFPSMGMMIGPISI